MTEENKTKATTAIKEKQREKEHKPSDEVSMRQLLECGVHLGHQTKR